MTVELLDTETQSGGGSEEEEEGKDERQRQLEQYVARFLGPGDPLDSLSSCTVNHLARKPVFLSRSVRRYRAKTRHKIVPRREANDDLKENETPVNNPNIRPGLGRHDKLNLSDSTIMWEEGGDNSCVINTDFKILWVVNSENYIYKRNALNRAKETHSGVCVRKYKSWSSWHSAWVTNNVTESQTSQHNDWMLGRVEGLRPNKTHRLTISDLNKAPYRTFTKFKVTEVANFGAANS